MPDTSPDQEIVASLFPIDAIGWEGEYKRELRKVKPPIRKISRSELLNVLKPRPMPPQPAREETPFVYDKGWKFRIQSVDYEYARRPIVHIVLMDEHGKPMPHPKPYTEYRDGQKVSVHPVWPKDERTLTVCAVSNSKDAAARKSMDDRNAFLLAVARDRARGIGLDTVYRMVPTYRRGAAYHFEIVR